MKLHAAAARCHRLVFTLLAAMALLQACAPSARAATVIVTNTADSGPGSLRQAILTVNSDNAPGEINFAVSGVITLVSDLPALTNSTLIIGPGTNLLTLSGGKSWKLFSLAANTTNRISDLKLASGFATNNSGAAIYNLGITVLQNCVLASNTVVGGFGGAVANFGAGSLFTTNCSFAYNTVQGGKGNNAPAGSFGGAGGGGGGLGGAIYTEGAALTMAGCNFLNNQAQGGAGGTGGTSGAGENGSNGGFPNYGVGGGSGQDGGTGGFGGGGGGGGYPKNGGAGGFAGGGGGSAWSASVVLGGTGGAFGGNGVSAPPAGFASGGGGGGAGLGGGFFARTGVVTVANCAFSNNHAAGGLGGGAAMGQGVGGGIFVLNAVLNLVSNTFIGNTAASQPDIGGSGSIIVVNLNDSGAGSLRDVIQVVTRYGAPSTVGFASALSGQTITLTSGQFTLTNSMTIDASTLPGGIQINGNASSRIFQVLSGSTVVLDSLTLTNGKTVGDSGAAILNSGNLTVTRCTLVGNIADFYGGGIETTAGQLTLNESTLTGNQCSQNGAAAIDNIGSTVTVLHSTVTGNTAFNGAGCGGIGNYSGTVTLYNSIVAGNIAVSSASNLDQTITFTGVNLTTGNPLLAPLGNYGGPTTTMPPLPGSPALNAATSGTSFTTDQRGLPRIVGTFADLGAVEGTFNPNYPIVNFTKLGTGNVRFNFTNLSGPSYRILATTNVAAPINTWSDLGAPLEAPAGTFTFTDLAATNYPSRFYRVTTP